VAVEEPGGVRVPVDGSAARQLEVLDDVGGATPLEEGHRRWLRAAGGRKWCRRAGAGQGWGGCRPGGARLSCPSPSYLLSFGSGEKDPSRSPKVRAFTARVRAEGAKIKIKGMWTFDYLDS
jgi:hypothetical protein